MHVNISVVSHGHFELIQQLGCIDSLAKKDWIDICIVDNVGEKGFKSWCSERNIFYIGNEVRLGFGENNNLAYKKFIEEKTINLQKDYFLVLNPDVVIDLVQLQNLLDTVISNSIEFSCINLYKDKEHDTYDNSVRKYPTLCDFLSSFILSKNKTIIDKSTIIEHREVDWASGSFLLFDVALYSALNGFDENYFMYCEDIDICLRANYMHNCKLMYLPEIHALHLAAHENRKLFSKHFIWHVKSMFRYLTIRNRLNIKKKLEG
ncbi:glycosyltransferase family 2 protein [Enterobacter huaxiensis]|uniref:glycosyltransferase family 2 protein n=1 Tax=Enterobacter huaxiensis TaxID=2494702 RepID=UPI002175FC3E|nr:glycosyltransferase family 2 protein [Enterobacter huaxiensis]MCS5449771.1 glycosyltransferase family 2 protein [Enterobacter huaxiensis]